MSFGGTESRRGERSPEEDEGRADCQEQEEETYAPPEDRGQTYGDPDVLLDVPDLDVEELDLEIEDLQVRVGYQAELGDLVKIDIGISAGAKNTKLQTKGVKAQARLKARLDNVRAIFSEVLKSLQYNPQFFRDASRTTDQMDEPAASSSPQGDEPTQRPLKGS